MPRLSPPWIAPACAVTTFSTATAAPGIWRCGNSYSDTPCEGGKHIDPDAPPSAEDRRQRDESTRRDQAIAERMQRERLDREARPRQALVMAPAAREPRSPAAPSASLLKADKKKKGARPKKSDEFIATYKDPAAPPASKKK